MPELDVPAPSLDLEGFRTEVDRRARALDRRYRRRTVGSVTVAVAVAAAAVLVALPLSAPPSHVSASGAVPHPSHRGSGSPTGAAGAGATAAAPEAESNGDNSTGTTGRFGVRGSNPVIVYERPSGSIVTATVGSDVLVVLAAPDGRWGRAVVDRTSRSVVSFVSQTTVGGTVQVRFRTRRRGSASVTVPSRGRPGAAWHGKIVVTAAS